MDFFDPALFALLQVMMIDIVLAGDNAVVIGMVAARVAARTARKVIFWGMVAAVVLRIAARPRRGRLLNILGLMLAGGILLLWVAWRLYRDLRHQHDGPKKRTKLPTQVAMPQRAAAMRVRRAIMQIALADLSMSLDNVLAVAGAAMHHLWVLFVGLGAFHRADGRCGHLIAKVLAKHRWIGYAGLLIVVYVALSMIWHGGHSVVDAVT